MNQNPLISVIVPVYNVEIYLNKCIDSIINQTYKNLEIILVDDGSKDQSGKICDEYAEKDQRIIVIHKENGGLSSARNSAIDIAKGEFLGFVDSDDWIELDMFDYLLHHCITYGAKMACAGRYDVDSATGKITLGLCPSKTEVINAEEMLGRLFTWDNCDSAAWDKLFHRSLFKTYRFPLNVTSEDLAILYKLIEKAQSIVMCNKPVYYYNHRPNSITTASFSDKNLHYEQHTSVIYPYIKEKYPKIENQVRFFRIRSLIYTTGRIAQADQNSQEKYQSNQKNLKRELRKHLVFIMRYKHFTKNDRIFALLLASNLYGLVRKVYRLSKR